MTLDDTTTAVTSHHHRANELYRLYLGSLTSMLFSSSSLSSSAIALWTRNGEFINSNASFFVLFGLCGGSGGGRDICIWKLFDKIQNQHSYWKKLDKCIQLHQSISKATSDASLSPLVDPRYQQTFWLNDLTINDATGRVSSVVCSVSCHCDDFGLPLILCGSFQKV